MRVSRVLGVAILIAAVPASAQPEPVAEPAALAEPPAPNLREERSINFSGGLAFRPA